jgi:hypothetical protein
MNVLTIFIFVLIIVLIYTVYKLMTNPTTTVSDLSDSSKTVIVPSSKTESNSTGNNNYGYSVWLYIDAWKTNGSSTSTSTTINKNILTRINSGNVPLFKLYLGNDQNDLTLELSNSTNPCVIRNVQLQKWINITMSIYGNTADMYLDGKLVRTCVMPVMPASLSSSDQLYIGGGYTVDSKNTISPPTPGDLQGFISNVVYNADYFSPEEAWNIYSAGYSGAGMFNFLHSYKLNFSITNNNQVVSQISI